MDGMNMERDKLKRSNDKLRIDNEGMEEEISKFKNERKLLFDKVEEINRSIIEMNDKLRSKDRLLQESQSEKRTLEKANNELKLELEQLNDEL